MVLVNQRIIKTSELFVKKLTNKLNKRDLLQWVELFQNKNVAVANNLMVNTNLVTVLDLIAKIMKERKNEIIYE
ncbi:hypothetical protein [Mycoplasmopsis agassizii]|uniref:Uncharacterized protein n=1 Tax=Mycoplasmopsis agassizii TaxID=33922 RepID=A0ABX4H4K5_9BACT|nr:hypothetical protein [Mycoplasmopsis agassizii]PAF54826.1 hypothetical protein CJF60_03770 [Mycoplasmopsis agassizii]SMC18658.1 hypothetical protein SAMN02745179_00742 [Mycoplasmopsis agassizii]